MTRRRRRAKRVVDPTVYGRLREKRWAEQGILFRGRPLTYEVFLIVRDTLQRGRCAICERKFYRPYRPVAVADHDHATAEFRGVLCSGHTGCNEGLVGRWERYGTLKNLTAEYDVIEYLRHPPASRVTAGLP